jgi:hypothetical protein
VSLGQDQARTASELGQGASSITQGTCLSVDWATGYAMVNVSGGEVRMPMVTTAPAPGDQVWVGYLGKQPILLGIVARAAVGTITAAPSSGKVEVTGDDAQKYLLPYNADTTLTLNQRVAIDWDSRSVAFRLSSDTPPPDEIVTPGIVNPGPQERTFTPTNSGTWNGSRYYTSQVNCSDSQQGIYVYGRQIAETIPDNALIDYVGLDLSVVFDRYPSSLATFGLHTREALDGAPGVSGGAPVSAGSGRKDLPTSFGEALKTGAALGVGTNHGGYHGFAPAGQNNSGALTIRYHF